MGIERLNVLFAFGIIGLWYYGIMVFKGFPLIVKREMRIRNVLLWRLKKKFKRPKRPIPV